MRRRALIAVTVALAAAAVAGEPSGRVVLLRESDGTPRIVNYPCRSSKAVVPRGSTNHREALWRTSSDGAYWASIRTRHLVIRWSPVQPNAVSPKGGVMKLM
jgi:hypothetical protein